MKLGVVIGRFQTHRLHEGHVAIIGRALADNDRVLVVIGDAPVPATRRNPLSVPTREQVIRSTFGPTAAARLTFGSLADHPDDNVWSANLDDIVAAHATTLTKVALYAGRDSFAPYYTGRHAIVNVDTVTETSATELRRQVSIGYDPVHPESFAAGAIWAASHRYPTVFTTVDMVVTVTVEDRRYLLLGNKGGYGGAGVFPGGFADPGSTDEEDATRELEEETAINVPPSFWQYLGSLNVDDWRYRGSGDGIRTRVYAVDLGPTRFYPAINTDSGADADLAGAAWVPLTEAANTIHPSHLAIYELAQQKGFL